MHASIADVIADTAQNSIEAGAKNVTVRLVEDGEYVSVSIADNGKGKNYIYGDGYLAVTVDNWESFGF